MTKSQNAACARLKAVGLHQDTITSILSQVDSWVKSSGKEWTVSRLKDLKTIALYRSAGLDVPHELVQWKRHTRQGRLKGPFWKLVNLSPNSSKEEMVKCFNALMVYSDFVADYPTKKQWTKFRDSVESPRPSKGEIPMTSPKKVKHRSFEPFELKRFVTSPSKRAPYWDADRKKLCTSPETDVETWADASVSNRYVWKASCTSLLSAMPEILDRLSGMEVDPYVGKISFIQEPGYKLRAVANPNRFVQMALTPLQECLLDVLKSMERDCTHDQDKGISKVKGWIDQGLTVHSVDLSDATNNFPLSLQMYVLRHMLTFDWDESLQFFEECSKGRWQVYDPVQKKHRDIVWAKGQPLGLAPSFPAFALAHHYLAENCISSPSDDFVILGDDIAMVGEGLRSNYLHWLDHLGCPISSSKTISSDIVAEFAGKIIHKQGVLSTFKWRTISDDSFLDVARQLGPRSLGLLQPRQRKVINQIASLPEWDGGLGWNPKGLPLEIRISQGMETLRERQDRIESRVASTSLERHFQFCSLMPALQAEGSAPTRRVVSRGRNTKDNILSTIRPLDESFSPDEKSPGYRRTADLRGDPRKRKTTLKAYESRLIPKTPQSPGSVKAEQMGIGWENDSSSDPFSAESIAESEALLQKTQDEINSRLKSSVKAKGTVSRKRDKEPSTPGSSPRR